MNRPDSLQSKDDRLLATLGGQYILRMQINSQLISSLMGPPIGLYFIFICANLTVIQIIELLVSLVIFIGLINVLLPIYVRLESRQAKARLDHIYMDRPLSDNVDEATAWKEILTLPGKTAISQLVSSLILVTLPLDLFMWIVGGVNWFQITIITIGGSLAEMAILIQGILYMDSRLAAARQALLPSKPSEQIVQSGFGLATRQYFIVGFLLLATQLTAGVLVYSKFTAALMPGANIADLLKQLQMQFGIIGTSIFILGIFLASRLFQATYRPIQEMISTIDKAEKGDLTQQAAIITSDESAQLTIRLNQMLERLKATQIKLETQIEEGTTDLIRKTQYLQSAALVAQDAAELQDLNTLLNRTAEMISNRFGFYHVGIFLLDDSGAHAILQAASSEGGQRMLARGHALDVGLQGLVGAAAFQNQPRVVMEVDSDKDYYKNPDLPMTRSEAAIPLTAHDRVLGVLDIQSRESSAFSQDDIEVLQTMANQIGLAIRNAQLLSESQNAVQRMEIASAENIRRVWREHVHNNKHSYRYASMGLTAVTQLGNMPNVGDTASNSLNIPITLRGQSLGTIVLRRTTENAWSETDRSLAIEIAGQVGLALENARLLDEAQRRAVQESSLSELAAKLSRSLDPDILLQTAIRELHQLPDVSGVSVYLELSEKSSPDEAT